MSELWHDNEGLTELVQGYDDGELLRLRVTTIRQMGRLADFLAILNEERRGRAPDNMEATVLPLQRASGEPLIVEGLE